MGKYKLINTVLGWIVFAIASTVYLMTMEPTASFWYCGEFISSAYKLEVGHPPGAPFFMLTANLFTQLASDPSTVAKMVNTMSALFSGLTILFLFCSIHSPCPQDHGERRRRSVFRPDDYRYG